MPFTVRQNPQTKQNLLVFGVAPEFWDGPHVTSLLRVVKQHFPDEYEEVGRELILPLNGRPGLQLPDDIGGKPNA